MITFVASAPWSDQRVINSSQSAALATWSAGGVLSTARRDQGVLVTNSRVYLIGGFNGANPTTTVYEATIDGSGVIGSFSTSSVSLPAARASIGVALTRNRAFFIGGINNSADTESNVIYTATIGTDGVLGTISATTSLPDVLSEVDTFVYNGSLYAVGRRYIYAAPINEDGTLGTWEAKGDLDFNRPGRVIWWTGTRLYVWGGSADEMSRYSVPSDGSFGTWNNGPSTADFAYRASCIQTSNTIYLFGGDGDNSTSKSAVYRASITNGVVGSFTTDTSLNVARDSAAVAVTSTRAYLLGGRTDTTFLTSTSYASFSGGFNNYLTKSFEVTNDIVVSSPREVITATGGPLTIGVMTVRSPKESIVSAGSAYDTRAAYVIAEFENWEMEANSGASLESEFELFECTIQGSTVIHGDISGSFELLQCDSYSGAAMEGNIEEWIASGESHIDVKASMEAQFEFFDMAGEISWSIQAQLEDSFVKFTCDGVISKKDANIMTGDFELFECSGEISKVKRATIDAAFIPFSCTGSAYTSVDSVLEAAFEAMVCEGEINKSTAFESIKYVR